MKFQTLNNKGIKIFIGIVVVIVLVGATVILTTSKAKYRTTQSIPLVRGKINWKPSDLNLVAMYQEDENGEYQSVDTVPSSGYTLNTTESYCEVNKEKVDNITLEYKDGLVNFYGISQKGTKCYVYFDVEVSASSTILANVTLGTGTPNFSKTSCSNGCGEVTVGVYEAQDDDGTSYYFRGDVTNNYVKFAGFYWRIVRINGDGSIRLIYEGNNPRVNGTVSTDTQIGTSAFNSAYNDNMYVGYMYTSGQLHGIGTSSTIKGVLDNWFTSNLNSYTSYIDYDAGFCGDRTAYTDLDGNNSGGGTGTTVTYYGAYVRLFINETPVLTCASAEDLYTMEGSSKGNKVLTYPIGLITADEVWYAGGTGTTNYTYYLYTGQDYWTMSPNGFFGSTADALYVRSVGNFNSYNYNVGRTNGVRPVINLRADTKFKDGSLGTMESPYIVEGAE